MLAEVAGAIPNRHRSADVRSPLPGPRWRPGAGGCRTIHRLSGGSQGDSCIPLWGIVRGPVRRGRTGCGSPRTAFPRPPSAGRPAHGGDRSRARARGRGLPRRREGLLRPFHLRQGQPLQPVHIPSHRTNANMRKPCVSQWVVYGLLRKQMRIGRLLLAVRLPAETGVSVTPRSSISPLWRPIPALERSSSP